MGCFMLRYDEELIGKIAQIIYVQITALYSVSFSAHEVVKLWNYFSFSADDLFAQGMLSFSELRNRPMLPRWFNFYGYNPEELQ